MNAEDAWRVSSGEYVSDPDGNCRRTEIFTDIPADLLAAQEEHAQWLHCKGKILCLSAAAAIAISGSLVLVDTSPDAPQPVLATAPRASGAKTVRPSEQAPASGIDHQKGSIEVHFIDLANTKPLTRIERTKAVATIESSIKLLHDKSNGAYTKMPVVVGADVAVNASPTKTQMCDDVSYQGYHHEAYDEGRAEAANGNISIGILNYPDIECPTATKAAAVLAPDYIGVNSGSKLLSESGTGVMAHELNHIGPADDTPSGHDSVLSGCEQTTTTGSIDIDATRCTGSDEYGNIDTLMGKGAYQNQIETDPDIFTGFQAHRLGMIADNQVHTITSDQHLELSSLATAEHGAKIARIPIDGVTLPPNKLDQNDTVVMPSALYVEISQQNYLSNEGITQSIPQVTAYFVNEHAARPSTYTLPLSILGYAITQHDTISRRIKMGNTTLDLQVVDMQAGTQVGEAKANLRLRTSE
jgi:hypothetical protein